MVIIDPQGMFYGKRIGACSDYAQHVYWRFLAAANGYGRLELNFNRLRAEVFASLREKPSDEVLLAVFREYVANRLAMPYEDAGDVWIQFVTARELLPRYKTAIDRRSPEPDLQTFEKFSEKHKSLTDEDFRNFPKIFQSVRAAVAVAVAVAVAGAVAEVKKAEPVESVQNGEEEKQNLPTKGRELQTGLTPEQKKAIETAQAKIEQRRKKKSRSTHDFKPVSEGIREVAGV